MPDINFDIAPKDVMFHCSDGLVTANSLLLAVISPSVRRLLESRREQEEQFHLSCPGLQAAHLTCFLSDVYTGDKDIKVPDDVRNFIFPTFELSKVFFKTDAYLSNISEFVKEELHDDDSEFEDHKTSEDLKEDFSAPDSDFTASEEDDSDYEEPQAKKREAKKTKADNMKIKELRGEKYYNRFSCVMCEQSFRRSATMLSHVDKKHGPKPAPKCEICGEIFDTHGKMVYHRGILHGSRVPCKECGKLFPESQLNDHMLNTHEVCEPISCEKCGAVFTNRRRLKRHRKEHDEPKVPQTQIWLNKYKENCFCNLDLTTIRSKINHYKIVHEKQEQCPKCNRIVKDTNEKAHRCEKKPATKPLQKAVTCSICGKIYTKNVSYWYHMKTAHNNETVECEVCGKEFKSYLNRKDHYNKMHKEKTACQICGKLVSNLKEHVVKTHTEEADMKFKCEVCGKGLATLYKYNEHKRIHSGERPHKCREGCEMAFADKSNRNQHERRVHGARGGLHRRKASVMNY